MNVASYCVAYGYIGAPGRTGGGRDDPLDAERRDERNGAQPQAERGAPSSLTAQSLREYGTGMQPMQRPPVSSQPQRSEASSLTTQSVREPSTGMQAPRGQPSNSQSQQGATSGLVSQTMRGRGAGFSTTARATGPRSSVDGDQPVAAICTAAANRTGLVVVSPHVGELTSAGDRPVAVPADPRRATENAAAAAAAFPAAGPGPSPAARARSGASKEEVHSRQGHTARPKQTEDPIHGRDDCRQERHRQVEGSCQRRKLPRGWSAASAKDTVRLRAAVPRVAE